MTDRLPAVVAAVLLLVMLAVVAVFDAQSGADPVPGPPAVPAEPLPGDRPDP